MKKAVSFILAATIILSMAIPAFAAEPELVSPCYVNASTVDVSLTISTSGTARVTLTCVGAANVTGITVSAYIEKYVGGTWVRVDNGQPSDMWTYSVVSTRLAKSYTTTILSQGEYRAVATFTINGTTSETITLSETCSY